MAVAYVNQRSSFGRFTGAVWTVYKRQILRLLNSKIQIVFMMLQPLMWLLIIGQAFNNLFDNPAIGNSLFGGVDYITYMTPGIMMTTVMMTSMFGVINMFYDRDSGYLKNYLIAPISNTAIVIGYALGIYTRVLIQVAAILGIALGIGADIPLDLVSVGYMFIFPVVTSFFLSGIAVTFASRAPNVEVFQAIIMPISMPLMFLSPMMFPVDVLPDYLAPIAKVNPITLGIEGLRAELFGREFAGDALINIAIFNDHIALFNIALLLVVGLLLLIGGSRIFLRSLIK